MNSKPEGPPMTQAQTEKNQEQVTNLMNYKSSALHLIKHLLLFYNYFLILFILFHYLISFFLNNHSNGFHLFIIFFKNLYQAAITLNIL